MNSTAKELELSRKMLAYESAMHPFFLDPKTHADAATAMLLASGAGILAAAGQISTADFATMVKAASEKTGIPLQAISLGADVAKLMAECSGSMNVKRGGGDA